MEHGSMHGSNGAMEHGGTGARGERWAHLGRGVGLEECRERGELGGAEDGELAAPELNVHLVALRVGGDLGVRQLHHARALAVGDGWWVVGGGW